MKSQSIKLYRVPLEIAFDARTRSFVCGQGKQNRSYLTIFAVLSDAVQRAKMLFVAQNEFLEVAYIFTKKSIIDEK